ncbi:MAG TPA: HupE/UreJ family protein [Usitatibacter sp.]|jgi:hypothetical protein|nr:HupE/UreJ family protein [Usitatibacter sp.]
MNASGLRRWLSRAAAVFLMAPATAPGHEFKLDATMSAFVKVEGGETHLVVRAPLYLFKSARFPVSNIEIDVPASQEALARSLTALRGNIQLFEEGQRLTAQAGSARLSLPSDRSFESYAPAVRHVAQPVPADTRIVIDQGYVDAHFVYALHARAPELSIRTTAAPELGDYLKLAIRFMPAEGAERAMVVTSASGTVALNPGWWHAASGFIGMGMTHILTGADHLLFLLCLIIPLRGWRAVLAIVTAFTVAHSFTLIGSAFHLAPAGAWFPPFVETAIAASIVYMALENIMGVKLGRRILLTGLFGLVHGFGFSYGLQENLQFAGTHLIVSLFAFNVGIELGQLLALAFMLPALVVVRRYVLPGRVGMVILSAVVAQTGWQWMMERGADIAKAPWPHATAAGLAVLTLWISGIVLAALALNAAAAKIGAAPAADTDSMPEGRAD